MGKREPYLSDEQLASLVGDPSVVVAGCDEAGRGCLAGPVFAGAVILPDGFEHPLLRDSKKLSSSQRDEIRPVIEENAIAWAVASVDADEIDRINILNASIEAMHRALIKLFDSPQYRDRVADSGRKPLILVDGNRFKPFRGMDFRTIVKGDARVNAIAAASILAKTHKDEYLLDLAKEFPQYGWERNAGYPTKEHRDAIRQYGPCKYHRMSYNLLPEEELLLF